MEHPVQHPVKPNKLFQNWYMVQWIPLVLFSKRKEQEAKNTAIKHSTNLEDGYYPELLAEDILWSVIFHNSIYVL